MPEFLTIQETAELLRLGERAVYDMLRQDRLPGAAKAGGKWRVHRKKIIKWMAAGGELADGNQERTPPTQGDRNDTNV